MYNTELYDSFLQRQNAQQYSISNITKTLVVCGAFLINAGVPIINAPPKINLHINKEGSGSYIINDHFSSYSSTWSDVETTYASQKSGASDLRGTFNVLSKLAFLEGDAEAEKKADLFFDQIQVKTKKIMVSTKV